MRDPRRTERRPRRVSIPTRGSAAPSTRPDRRSDPMQTLFVTGGAGFIGSAFVRLVLEQLPGCSVVNFDALTYAGNPDNLRGLDPQRHRFVRGDVADRDAVLAALPN